MKKFIFKICKFLNYEIPWWISSVFGLVLAIVPCCYAAFKGITTLEPGFSYGVFYGIGLLIAIDGFFRSFKKKEADQEKTGH